MAQRSYSSNIFGFCTHREKNLNLVKSNQNQVVFMCRLIWNQTEFRSVHKSNIEGVSCNLNSFRFDKIHKNFQQYMYSRSVETGKSYIGCPRGWRVSVVWGFNYGHPLLMIAPNSRARKGGRSGGR